MRCPEARRAGFRGGCAVLLALLCAACAHHPGGRSGSEPLPEDPQRLILLTIANPAESISLQAGSSLHGYGGLSDYSVADSARATAAALARRYDLRLLRAWPINPLKVHCIVVEIPPNGSRSELLARLKQDSRVRLAQPFQVFSTLSVPNASNAADGGRSIPTGAYNDPYVGLQRGFARINAGGAQQWSSGAGVEIAVIDTGVDSDHPDLKGRIAGQKNFVDDDAPQFREDRHGTAVAGVIAAVANNGVGIVGVAPQARLLAFKACRQRAPDADAAECTSFTLAQALSAALESDAKIVNLSLGGPADPLLAQLVDYGLQHGVIFVGAVPPNGSLLGFPVGIPGVIAVDIAGAHATSAGAVLRAPGTEILTLRPEDRYDFVSGSSLAAAHVSGAVALLLAAGATPDASALRALLAQSGSDGSIDVCEALRERRGNSGNCPPVAITAPPASAAAMMGAPK